MRPTRYGGRLSTRLFAAQALIVVAGAVTLALVAAVVAPGLFRAHLQRAIGPVSDEMAHHLDQALATALLLSLTIAVAAALLTTLAVSWFLTRRLGRPIARMATAATRVAAGAYETRVEASHLGVEFAALDEAFNRMASTLEHTERRRRELFADLAHELRTPVATLGSFLEGIEDGVIPAQDDTWRTMREQTGRLRRLIDDIDAVSRAEERQLDLRPRSLVADEVIVEAIRAATVASAQAGVSFEHRRAASPVRVLADPDRLHEILGNLIGNALRHTPAGGVVTITASRQDGRARITVSDTGDGIAAANLPHVFDRFYRADPARSRRTGGTGIGLTIARALARAHGGDLRAASGGLGRGAEFTLTLPSARPN